MRPQSLNKAETLNVSGWRYADFCSQINVESFKGVVPLSGFVDSAQAVTKAVEIANSE
jgi:hypothetical protein